MTLDETQLSVFLDYQFNNASSPFRASNITQLTLDTWDPNGANGLRSAKVTYCASSGTWQTSCPSSGGGGSNHGGEIAGIIVAVLVVLAAALLAYRYRDKLCGSGSGDGSATNANKSAAPAPAPAFATNVVPSAASQPLQSAPVPPSSSASPLAMPVPVTVQSEPEPHGTEMARIHHLSKNDREQEHEVSFHF